MSKHATIRNRTSRSGSKYGPNFTWHPNGKQVTKNLTMKYNCKELHIRWSTRMHGKLFTQYQVEAPAIDLKSDMKIKNFMKAQGCGWSHTARKNVQQLGQSHSFRCCPKNDISVSMWNFLMLTNTKLASVMRHTREILSLEKQTMMSYRARICQIRPHQRTSLRYVSRDWDLWTLMMCR